MNEMDAIIIGALISGVIGITVSVAIAILQHFLIQRRERDQLFNELSHLVKKYEEIGPNPPEKEGERIRKMIRQYINAKFDLELHN